MSFDLKLDGGSLRIGSSGNLETVTEDKKLLQDVLKIIFTPTGTHTLHPWYGSPIIIRTVGKVLEDDILDNEIQSSVTYAVKNLQTLQQMQARDGQFLSSKEAIARLQNVEAYRDPNDRRQIVIIISIVTRSGLLVEESFSISI